MILTQDKVIYRSFKYFFFIIFIFNLLACSNGITESNSQLNENLVRYSDNIEIIQRDGYTAIHISDQTNNLQYKYGLVKDNKTKVPSDYLKIKTPIQSINIFNAPHVGMLKKIDCIHLIKGVDESVLYDEKIKELVASGSVKKIGSELLPRIETILLLKPDVLVYSGFDKELKQQKILEKTGIICVPNFEWMETNPLGRAEWLLFFGFLAGKGDESVSIFKEIEKRYLNLIKGAPSKALKSVMIGNLIGDYWYTPGGKSYFAQLLRDAGVYYLYSNSDETVSLQFNMEKVLKDQSNADIWLNPMQSNLNLLLHNNNKARFFKSFKQKQVYCYSHNLNNYWENSAVEPDKILADIISIAHSNGKSSFNFYKKLQ